MAEENEPAFERIETLIPYKESDWEPTARMPKLDPKASPWATCTRLGKYLLSPYKDDRDRLAELAVGVVGRVYGAGAGLERLDQASLPELVASIAGKAHGSPLFLADPRRGRYVVVGLEAMGKRYLGEHSWHFTRHYSESQTILCVSLPRAVGALALMDGLGMEKMRALFDTDRDRRIEQAVEMAAREAEPPKSLLAARDAAISRFEADKAAVADDAGLTREIVVPIVQRILEEDRRTWCAGRFETALFHAAVDEFWGEEWSRDLNRRAARAQEKGHSATVWVDKKGLDPEHVEAARGGFIGTSFKHVEIDDSVDLEVYQRMQREFQARFEAREIPQVEKSELRLRFRKCGRHRAIGLYSPVAKTVVVDPRHPVSLLHEFAHAYDYAHGQLSCSPKFRGVIEAFKSASLQAAHADPSHPFNASERLRQYAFTPTEVFARSWEIFALEHDRGGSFVRTFEEYQADPLYKPLCDDPSLLMGYFDGLLPENERPLPLELPGNERDAWEGQAVGEGARVAEAAWAAAKEGEQFSLF